MRFGGKGQAVYCILVLPLRKEGTPHEYRSGKLHRHRPRHTAGHTSLRYDPEKGQVILLRTGEVRSQLIVEEGKRHQCTYDTGCGTIILGVNGSRIEAELDETGGTLEFHYSLDVNTTLVSENDVYVTVIPR